MERSNSWRSWAVGLRGLAAIAFGIISLAAPGPTFTFLVLLFGVYAIVDGILELGLVPNLPAGSKSTVIVRGIISVAAGVIVFVWPAISALALLYVIAAWAVIAGIAELGLAAKLHHVIDHEWLLAFEGVVAIVFGIALFLSPEFGVVVLGLWVGAYALIIGGMLVATALRLRHYDQAHAPPGAATPAAA